MKNLFVKKSLILYLLTAIVPTLYTVNCHAAVLVKNGKATSTIVISPHAPRTVQRSAKLLNKYIHRVSGAKLSIVNSPNKVHTPTIIWVGWNKLLARAMPNATQSNKSPLVQIICKDNQLAIFGHDRIKGGVVVTAGTLNAVISFLQRNLDIRWFWPGELGEYVPKHTTITINHQVYQYTPQLKERNFRMMYHELFLKFYPSENRPSIGEMKKMDAQDRLWLMRQHAGKEASMSFSAGHAFTHWYGKYHKEHPDYFALQPDGSRAPYPSARNVKLNIANPAVVKQWVDNAVKAFKRNPARLGMSAAVDDGAYSGFDTSAASKAMDPEPGPGVPMVTLHWQGITKKHVALTDRYFKFYNKLAEGLNKRLPPQRPFYITVYAYCALRTPPVETKANNHLIVQFVGDMLGSGKGALHNKALWRAWSQKASRLIWRPNMYHYLFGMPGILTHRVGKLFRFLANHHIFGIDVDSLPNNWATQGLQYYLMAKLAWNPRLDVNDLVNDYIHKAFGNAASPWMKRYFVAMEQASVRSAEHTQGLKYYQRTTVFPEIYTDAWFKKITHYLSKAQTAVAQSKTTTVKQKKRLDFMETGLKFMKAQRAAIKAMKNLQSGSGKSLIALAKNAIKTTQKRDNILQKQVGTFAVSAVYQYATVARRHLQRFLGPPPRDIVNLVKHQGNRQQSILLPLTWNFRLDPNNKGVVEHWYRANVAKNLSWQPIRVTNWWGPQLLSDNPDAPVIHGYHGIAWYQVSFNASPPKGKQAWLNFGAVDESCAIYLNGKLIGQQTYSSKVEPDSWQMPRRFNVTRAIQSGRNNLTVRVVSLTGEGGIYKPVSLNYLSANLVPNGDFEHGETKWSIRSGRGLSATSIATNLSHGKYVDTKSLEIHVNKIIKSPASARQTVATPLPPGRYAFSVRYRMTLKNNRKIKNSEFPMRVRLSPYPLQGKSNTQEYVWLRAPMTISTGNSTRDKKWRLLSGLVHIKPKDHIGRFSITLFFYQPGAYQIDQVSLRRISIKPN